MDDGGAVGVVVVGGAVVGGDVVAVGAVVGEVVAGAVVVVVLVGALELAAGAGDADGLLKGPHAASRPHATRTPATR